MTLDRSSAAVDHASLLCSYASAVISRATEQTIVYSVGGFLVLPLDYLTLFSRGYQKKMLTVLLQTVMYLICFPTAKRNTLKCFSCSSAIGKICFMEAIWDCSFARGGSVSTCGCLMFREVLLCIK